MLISRLWIFHNYEYLEGRDRGTDEWEILVVVSDTNIPYNVSWTPKIVEL